MEIDDDDFVAIRTELNRAAGFRHDFDLPPDQWLGIIEVMRDHARAWVQVRTLSTELMSQHDIRAKGRRARDRLAEGGVG